MRPPLAVLGFCVALSATAAPPRSPVVVASKPFGESYVLAEMFAQLLEAHGIAVERKPGLGSTEIAFDALRTGAIDVYPEYTGTGLVAILHDQLPPETLADPRAVFGHVANASLRRFGVRWLPPLGFQNSFALAVRPEFATALRLRTLSDLARNGSKQLKAGFTPDFIERPDGLLGLVRAYGEGIRPANIKPLLPALKYQALDAAAVDLIDGFSTDGLLERYHLVVLEDDLHFFPPYEAAAILGPRAAARDDVVAVLSLLSGRISEATMRGLNARIEINQEPAADVAASALRSLGLDERRIGVLSAAPTEAAQSWFGAYLWEHRVSLLHLTLMHLWLVAIALLTAGVVAIPLGLLLERVRNIAPATLGVLGMLQTIPSIALLAFMVPLLGIGGAPALVALWLYALYPIARGTFTGVRDADPSAVEAAEALGMTSRQALLQIRLPLAAPVIMTGVRTAAVVTVGAATLAAFIGAGGLGEPIVTGLALADTRMVLSGALPAAALALLVDLVLAMVERRLVPAHLRKRTGANE